MSTIDTIIIGSSVNALTAAAYLARDGRRVLVLESSQHLGGGAMSTTTFHDGFKADIGLMSGRLDQNIVSDLKLEQFGLELIQRNSITSLLPEGRNLTLSTDLKKSEAAINTLSKHDAESYAKFWKLLDNSVDFLRAMYAVRPSEHPATPADLKSSALLVSKLRGYGDREMTEIMRVFVMPVRDFLDEWFENAELKGLLGILAIRGLRQGPFAGGTTFNLLHHLAIGDGYFRASARGGIGAICAALLEAGKQHSVEFRAQVGKVSIIIKDGRATGVRLENGEEISASEIISDHDAQQTFRNMVDPSELEPEFNRQVSQIRSNGCIARLNLALYVAPTFTNLNDEALHGTLVCANSITQLERAFDDAKRGGMSKSPFMEICIPSLRDESLAPAGKQVMSISLQYAPFSSKVSAKAIEEVALNQLSEFSPDLRKQIIHTQVITPADFESNYKLTQGHLYGGDMTLAQTFYMRPIAGFGQYRTPIENLYLCGSATHPGGGISGLSGKLATLELKVPELLA